MSRHRIRADQLQVGAPLPVDVYDGDNRLLLRSGNIIATESQLERLVEHGLFSDQPLPRHAPSVGGAVKDTGQDTLIDGAIRRSSARTVTRVSIYAEVVAATRTLDRLLATPQSASDFAAAISELAAGLRRACALDSDAALAHILFAREARYPIRQAISVAIVSALLLERLGFAEARIAAAVSAALTMNFSVVALQEQLYRQKEMDDGQRRAMHEHPQASASALAQLGVTDALWLALVEQHHECIDGSGYPHKLAGPALAREAQVIGLADRYCSMIAERTYRPGVAPELALTLIRTKSGSAIDPTLIDELVCWMGIYPPGTVVELFNRDVAVVTRRLRDPRRPVVYAVCGQNLRPFETPRKRMTSNQPSFAIERVFPRETIKFEVDCELLWPRTVTEVTPAA